MQPDAPIPENNQPVKGLPAVTPPSGRFIAQLFLVPGLIVTVAVLILLGFRYLIGGTRTPEEYLKNLDNPNPEVRWRAAHDLAQVLKRPESLALASDPKFALDLADRLRVALDEIERDETATATRTRELSKGERDSAWLALAPKRRYVQFLSGALGSFTIPVGVPLLSETALKDRGPDAKGIAVRRHRAVWALANLGENLKRYADLTPEQQEAVLDGLEGEAQGRGPRAEWARTALAYLRDKKPLGVDQTLARCAEADDPSLREMVAFALNFWDGPAVEETLVRLSGDDGHGVAVDLNETD
jgi:hypothetical protein